MLHTIFYRLVSICRIIWRYDLDYYLTQHRFFYYILFFRRPFYKPAQRAVQLRQALEALGPLFIKLGQMLSTRLDLLPPDLTKELTHLQDRVQPTAFDVIQKEIEHTFGCQIHDLFDDFDTTCVASASIAQVYKASIDGQPVAVKVLRPRLEQTVKQDIALMHFFAWLIEKGYPASKRLKPRAVIQEFARNMMNELDLLYEAANCSQMRRDFESSPLAYIPKIYWRYCRQNILVMEWIHAIPISHIHTLQERRLSLKNIAAHGIQIFFQQVLETGFFHGDMHPGNIFIDDAGRYILIDFGIMGSLSTSDKNYLAINFLAFFKRDYRAVAEAHLEAGWVPADTRVDHFEMAVRYVCEPIFGRTLQDISFGLLLLKLLHISREFGLEVQPQLMLLQKTLLTIEGLSRMLYPQLDLWQVSQPMIEKWMSEQIGWRSIFYRVREQWPHWSREIPELPHLAYRFLEQTQHQQRRQDNETLNTVRTQLHLTQGILGIVCVIILIGGTALYHMLCR